ncbi:MAG: DNA alkylation repair protein [Candidatus Aminicenantes bacterium]|nr:DNA alkylation repair protein [Candidatus Aminicenantes bacterium]
MKKIDEKFLEVRKFCEENADPKIEKKYARYFTEGYDAYGVDPKKSESQRKKWLEDWNKELSLDDYVLLGEKLLSSGKYEEGNFAVSFIYSLTDRFLSGTFDKLGGWLESGIRNWAHTDVLAGKALSHFFTKGLLDIEVLTDWTGSPSKWKRRAVPVTLIETLKPGAPLKKMFSIIESLMADSEIFVQKGLGWFLREAWKMYPEETEKFLLKWKDTCGRTIIQYATEKMDKENKSRFRRSKK